MRILSLCLLLLSMKLTGQPDSIILLVERTSSIPAKIEILNDAAVTLKNSDLSRSFAYATQAYQLANEIGDDVGLIRASLCLGQYNTKIGRHKVAMKSYLEALSLSQKIKDDRLISQTYKVIGSGYYFKNDIPLSLQYYKKALQLNLTLEDEESAADLQNNIALIFTDQLKLDSAELYLKEAAIVYDNLEIPGKLANTWLNWGIVKEKQQLFSEAIVFYQKALAINQARGLKLQEGYALAQLVSALAQVNRFDEADIYGQKALAIALSDGFQALLVNTYDVLYQLAKARNDQHQALTYHEKLLAAKELVFNTEHSIQIEELRTKYESEQKDRENSELIKEAQLRENQLWKTRMFLGFTIFFILIVCVLAYNYYHALQKNKQARSNLQVLNDEIQVKNEEVKAQADELTEAYNEIASINENLESLVKEKSSRIILQNSMLTQYAYQNAHKVRGPLARIMGLVSLIKLENVEDKELLDLLTKIELSTAELDSVVREINAKLEDEPILKS